MTVGLVDQIVIACANAANTLLALALLDRARAGMMLLSVGVGYLVLGVNRAFVGEVLLTLASRYDGEHRQRLLRNGVAAAFAFAVSAAALLLIVWVVAPARGGVDLRDLVWVAPFLPSLLLHDTGRYSYLSQRTPRRALVIDAVWVSTQMIGVAVLAATGHATAGGLLVCWGLGATLGATVFLARSRLFPWRGSPLRWAAETRRLAGWFTATALVGQLQGQAVGFLVASQLSARELSGLRGAQTALLQPVQNFITAVIALLVPRSSRLAARAAEPSAAGQTAAANLRRQTRTLAIAFTILGAAMVAIVVPLARTVLTHLSKFADIAPLALPIAIQPAIYLVQLPFAAAIRGMHRARLIFTQYVIFTTTSLSGLVVGTHIGRLPGGAWGLTTGSAVGLIAMIALYWHAQRSLDHPSQDQSQPSQSLDQPSRGAEVSQPDPATATVAPAER